MTKQPLSLAAFSETDEQLGDDTSQKYLVKSFRPIWCGDEITPDCRQRVLMESSSKLARWLSALSEELCTKDRASANSRRAFESDPSSVSWPLGEQKAQTNITW